jgi:DNA-binding CsgD family transcriptional regulator
MYVQDLIQDLSGELVDAATEKALHDALGRVSRQMGFDHFALSFEARPCRDSSTSLLVHDYPDEWAKVYNGFDLAGADPVRRACDRALSGFAWRAIERLVPLTRQDRQMLAVGRESGIADGYTVPRHLPGEASGSCTFVVRPMTPLPAPMLVVAEIVGAVALGAAQRLTELGRTVAKPVLSDRQRECLLWSARGKTAPEIATILDISEETVTQHLKLARERYDVHNRTSLILCAIFDGLIGYSDIFRWWRSSRASSG